MASNSPGAGKAVVAASVPKHVADEIRQRASLLQWTVSKYTGELLKRWHERGAEPVTPLEDLAKLADYTSERAVAEDSPPPSSPAPPLIRDGKKRRSPARRATKTAR